MASADEPVQTVTSGPERAVKGVPNGESSAAGSQQAEGKGSRSASRTSRSNDSTDGKKGRGKGRKGKGNEKDAQAEQSQEEEKEKEVPKPILSEAPPPAINIWMQRKEQHAAKAKPTPSPSSTANPTLDNDSKKSGHAGEGDVQASASNGVNGDKPHRRGDQGPRRSGPRGNRSGEKDDKSTGALSPTVDQLSWPAPKDAAALDAQKENTQEKTERSGREGQDEAGLTQKRSWKKMEMEHTVVFNTPLPTRGGKSRGSVRGGREQGSARGAHGSAPNGANASASASNNEKSAPVNGSAAPKSAAPRSREGSIPSRGSQQAPSYVSKRVSADAASSKDQQTASPSTAAESTRDSGPEAQVAPSKKATVQREGQGDAATANAEPTPAMLRTHQHERNHVSHHKDGSHSGAPYRSNRGRDSGYRGRGGHNGPAGAHSQQSHFPSNGQYSHSQASFPSRSHGSGQSPPAYNGQYSAPHGQQSRGRSNKWTGAQGARGNGTGPTYPPRTPQTNDYPVQPFAQYYTPSYDPQTIAVIKQQLEYYFSVDNLCKDIYLRKHMDGSGWVHLNFIAGFKRMIAISNGDLEIIRVACSESDQIEFIRGDEDQIERVRNRHKYQNFVLPEQDRDPEFQNNGPKTFTYPQVAVPMTYVPVFEHPYPVYPVAYQNGIHYDAVNGVDVNGHHAADSRLSAGVAEYAPPQSPLTLESLVNFTDAQVENMSIIIYENKDDSASSDTPGVAGYVSNDSTSSQANGVSSAHPPAQSAGGEAPDAADNAWFQFKGVTWFEGNGPVAGNAKHLISKPYSEIRSAAIEQRSSAQPGETPADMRRLYEFWSQMLPTSFNLDVYTQFKDLALEDASKETPTVFGLQSLLKFYNQLLVKQGTSELLPQDRALPSDLQQHYQQAIAIHAAHSTN